MSDFQRSNIALEQTLGDCLVIVEKDASGIGRIATIHDTGVQVESIGQLIRGEHLRASRGLLDWSTADLSAACRLSFSTIRRLESNSTKNSYRSMSIVAASLMLHGIFFAVTNDGILAVGRRQRQSGSRLGGDPDQECRQSDLEHRGPDHPAGAHCHDQACAHG